MSTYNLRKMETKKIETLCRKRNCGSDIRNYFSLGVGSRDSAKCFRGQSPSYFYCLRMHSRNIYLLHTSLSFLLTFLYMLLSRISNIELLSPINYMNALCIMWSKNAILSEILVFDNEKCEQVDLSYYDLFGSLKLVLVNGHKLPAKQEVLFYLKILIVLLTVSGEK